MRLRDAQTVLAAWLLVLLALSACPSFSDKDLSDDDDAGDDTSPVDDDSGAGDDAADDSGAGDDTSADDDTIPDDDEASCDYSNDFEDGAENWEHGGAGDEWEYGSPAFPGGPTDCHSGDFCWGTDLDAEYQNNANAWLRSPHFNLAGNCRLRFWHWYDTALTTDKAFLEISDDGGITWDPLNNFSGQSDGWKEVTVSLVGRNGYHYLRWRLSTDVTFTAAGWYLDDVRIESAD